MTYTIELTDSFQKEFKRLSKDGQEHVMGVLERIRIRPNDFALRLSGSKAYRVRAGKLRIIIDIEEEGQKIIALKVGNRETVYSP